MIRGLSPASTGEPRPRRGITSGRNFSTTTSAFATSLKKISQPSAALRLSVIDFLLAFWARKLVPMSILFNFETLPRMRARSPPLGFSILTTSAPRSARCSVEKGPERTFVRSRTRTPVRAPMASLHRDGRGLRDGAGLVHRAPHVAVEEAGDVARQLDERTKIDVAAPTRALEEVHQVLGAGVAPRHRRERTAAEPGHRALERGDAGPQRRVAVGEGEAVGVVEVAGPLRVPVESAKRRVEGLDLLPDPIPPRFPPA